MSLGRERHVTYYSNSVTDACNACVSHLTCRQVDRSHLGVQPACVLHWLLLAHLSMTLPIRLQLSKDACTTSIAPMRPADMAWSMICPGASSDLMPAVRTREMSVCARGWQGESE